MSVLFRYFRILMNFEPAWGGRLTALRNKHTQTRLLALSSPTVASVSAQCHCPAPPHYEIRGYCLWTAVLGWICSLLVQQHVCDDNTCGHWNTLQTLRSGRIAYIKFQFVNLCFAVENGGCFHSRTVRLDIITVLSPNDEQENCFNPLNPN